MSAKSYKPASEWAKAQFGEDEVELDLSANDEADMLGNGHLEPVPQRYRVLSDNYAAGGQGEEFDGFFRIEIEQALIDGGHIKRVERPAKKTAAKKTADKKSD